MTPPSELTKDEALDRLFEIALEIAIRDVRDEEQSMVGKKGGAA